MNNNQASNAQAIGQNERHLTWLSSGLAVHCDIVKPWKNMAALAQQAGISLTIASGYRSFDRQLTIWNKKFNGELAVKDKQNNIIELQQLSDIEKVMAILTYSALPGASRQHGGTDIDIYASNLLPPDHALQLEPWEYQTNGYFFALSEWLQAYAQDFGFFFPYQYDQGGVAIEPWHLSFATIAQQYQQTLTVSALTQAIETSNIAGKQAILAHLPDIYQQYVININPANNMSDISKV